MWVYKKTESKLWTVGFYAPNGTWFTDTDHSNQHDAGARCHYLNGGAENAIDQLSDRLQGR